MVIGHFCIIDLMGRHYLKRLFKKRFGMTMREWREANMEPRP